MPDRFDELMALHDGESAGDDARKAEDKRHDDPESQEILRGLAAADKAFAAEADELLDAPVPASLVDAVRKAGAQAQQTAPPTQTAKIIPFPRRRGVIALAMAAGLAAVVATNTQLFEPAVDPGAGSASGYAALLQQVLETVPSGDLYSSDDGSASIVPMLSFRTRDSGFCREFMARESGNEFAGVACRQSSGGWEVLTQRSVRAASEDEAYRMAEGEDASAGEAAEILRLGDLSYEEEEAALRSGWSNSGL